MLWAAVMTTYIAGTSTRKVGDLVRARGCADGLDILLLEVDGEVIGATYLNLIPNLSRGAQPYAVIENVVIAKERRGQKLGRRLMDGTLDRAWAAGCYKAMLQTGSKLRARTRTTEPAASLMTRRRPTSLDRRRRPDSVRQPRNET